MLAPDVGMLALGVVALGVFALGVFALGVVALGVVALGVVAIGVVALGVVALGVVALGVVALGVGAAVALVVGAAVALVAVVVGALASLGPTRRSSRVERSTRGGTPPARGGGTLGRGVVGASAGRAASAACAKGSGSGRTSGTRVSPEGKSVIGLSFTVARELRGVSARPGATAAASGGGTKLLPRRTGGFDAPGDFGGGSVGLASACAGATAGDRGGVGQTRANVVTSAADAPR